MLRATERILRLAIVNGTKCCLKCFIIRYTKNWPKPDNIEEMIKSKANSLCYHMKIIKCLRVREAIKKIPDRMLVHLFMSAIISEGCGLYSTLISACKSGRNPSAMKWNSKNKIPKNYSLPDLFLVSGSANWNSKIPEVMIAVMIIFLGPSFSF